MGRKAALAARADALRARMRESHLANFRVEAKRRCGAGARPPPGLAPWMMSRNAEAGTSSNRVCDLPL